MGPHEMDPYVKKDEKGNLINPMFDVVILQGMSTEPIAEKSIPTFKKFLKQHVATVKAKGAEPIVVDTWGDFSQVCERSSQWCELRYSQVQTAH